MTIYLVLRKSIYADSEELSFSTNEYQQYSVPISSCLTMEEAEVERDRLEQLAREEVCPFRFVEMDYLDDDDPFSVESVLSLITDMGMTLPRAEELTIVDRYRYDFAKWWDENGHQMSVEQRDQIWDHLSNVRFYSVRECELTE